MSGHYFKNILDKFKPDIIHFFHLSRLSASLINVSAGYQIPMVFTATDFWFICPTSQLRLPDNSCCNGPDRLALNCLKHLVLETQPPKVISKVKTLPDFVIAAIIVLCRYGFFTSRWYYPYINALSRRQSFLRNQINRIDRVLVPTKIMESMLVRNGLSITKTQFCPYGIETKKHHISSKAASHKRENNLRVGFIGTLYVHKGAHLLIEAVQLLANAKIKLKIYGNLNEFPDYVAKLKNLAANDKRIEFMGTFPNSEINKVFSEIDVLVVPSIWYENTPLVIYSAQAIKCPVIATDLGGMSEAVKHEENGLLFKKGDVAGLAKLIERLIIDPVLLARLSNNAKPPRTSREYALDVFSVYDELLSKN